jgi:hypothetical protein
MRPGQYDFIKQARAFFVEASFRQLKKAHITRSQAQYHFSKKFWSIKRCAPFVASCRLTHCRG